jgi:hypothetical protein
VVKIWQTTHEKTLFVSLINQINPLKSWFGHQVLASVQVERLVIPAIADLVLLLHAYGATVQGGNQVAEHDGDHRHYCSQQTHSHAATTITPKGTGTS